MKTKGKILVVEDEALIAHGIGEELKKFGYKVSSKISYGEKVIEEVEKHCPDLILMDIKLKGGIETGPNL